MMKIGVRAHDFGRLDENELPRVIKEAGFEAVQLALSKAITGIGTFRDVTPSHLERVRRGFDANKLEISVLGCYIEPSLPDREKRLQQVSDFLLGLEHAKELGVCVAGTETTRFDPGPAHEPMREEAYQNLKDSVLRMAEAAEKLNVCIGLEPVADHTLNSSALTKRLLDEVGSDKLKIIFDPVNMILADTAFKQEDIYTEFLNCLGDKLVAVHLKDIVFENGEKIWRNIGQGIVKYDSVFEWLFANKPDIPLLREHVRMDSYGLDVAAMNRLAGKTQ